MRILIGTILMALCVALTGSAARGDDAAIAREISQRLEQKKQASLLQGFRISMKVEDGTVYMSGQVADRTQRDLALDVARRVSGVKLVVNDLTVGNGASTAPLGIGQAAYHPTPALSGAGLADPAASTALTHAGSYQAPPSGPVVADPKPVPGTYQRVSNQMPLLAPPSQPMAQPMPAASTSPYGQGPVHMAQAVGCASGDCGSGMQGGYGGEVLYDGVVSGGAGYGGPVPEHSAYATGPAGIAYEHPQMPAYAWPSYASYPNYAALTYPRQYSPQAWPYIGPFYPYPQVPLGWRKVTLEWDDGWWMLDFAAK